MAAWIPLIASRDCTEVREAQRMAERAAIDIDQRGIFSREEFQSVLRVRFKNHPEMTHGACSGLERRGRTVEFSGKYGAQGLFANSPIISNLESWQVSTLDESVDGGAMHPQDFSDLGDGKHHSNVPIVRISRGREPRVIQLVWFVHLSTSVSPFVLLLNWRCDGHLDPLS